jgi:phosphatidate cytidylyltransferase
VGTEVTIVLLHASLAGFALGAVGMAAANRRVAAPVASQRWFKFAVFFLIVHVVLGAAALGAVPLRALYLIAWSCCVVEAIAAWRQIAPPRPGQAWPVGAGLLLLATWATVSHAAATLVWCFMTVACADGFAQITGQLLGRRPLAPRLSPAKTLEGALGGLGAAMAVSVALRGTVLLGLSAAVAWGAAFAVAALAGDLAASWLKRRAGLKDFSAALPGQGGFLDRFDSLIAAVALLASPGAPP